MILLLLLSFNDLNHNELQWSIRGRILEEEGGYV